MATDFFEDFPRIAYTLDDGETEQIVTDIFKRVVLTDEFKNNSSFFETYEVLGGETPEEVSHRFYGTTKLHWLILLINDIVDPRFEWPVSDDDLRKVVSGKYGGDSSIFTTNRALNRNNKQIETYFLLTEDSTHKNPTRLTYQSNDENATNQPIAYANSSAIFRFESNYDVEQLKNENYRQIKVLKPEIVNEIVINYKTLINQ